MKDDPWRLVPQMAAAMAILAGGVLGTAAALDTGEPLRYLGTAVFLAITVPIYLWRFHTGRGPSM